MPRKPAGAWIYLVLLAYGPRWLLRRLPLRWRAAHLRALLPGLAALEKGLKTGDNSVNTKR